MATKTQTTKKAAERFNDVKFVSYNLTKDQTKELKAMPYELADIDTTFLRLLQEGYKVTFRWDEYNQCYACWLIPSGDTHDNAGYILAARGSTPIKALKQAGYIHWNVFEQLWSEWYQAKNGEEIDD